MKYRYFDNAIKITMNGFYERYVLKHLMQWFVAYFAFGFYFFYLFSRKLSIMSSDGWARRVLVTWIVPERIAFSPRIVNVCRLIMYWERVITAINSSKSIELAGRVYNARIENYDIGFVETDLTFRLKIL